ncbi:hypothetical protein D7D52_32695 [Nocardia yunnanensis]|uniref:Uncharacterized protein n=1 Tax=Nocardia yunnanensis TaxID=2382165 RepID=A0A386ZJR0_9NOCA|nr:hypothetical protein [Nocardia yunnanensis]AYF77791.1 hypothetical protein D7D52_32695 [Nocardia yunnanensis]
MTMPTNDDFDDERLADDLRTTADDLTTDLGVTAGDLRERAEAAAGQLAERASGAAAELAGRAQDAAADLADMAKAFADRITPDDLQGTLEQVRANLDHAAQDVLAAVNEIVTALKNRTGK